MGSMAQEGGPNWTFAYDARGMRIGRSNGTETYTYAYHNGLLTRMTKGDIMLYFTYDAAGTPMTVSLHTGTNCKVKKGEACGADCATYYYVTNLQGDVVAIINDVGTAVAVYQYDAWGYPTLTLDVSDDDIGTTNPLRYRGYVYDRETGLYYLQSRYYNPEIGRFINADDIEYLGADGTVVSHNIFAYCGNNPVNCADPSGHLAFFIVTAIIGAVIGLGATAAVDYVPDQEFNLHWGWYVGAGLAGAAIGAGIGMAASYYATGSIASSTSNVMSGLFGKTAFYRTMSADDYATLQSTGKIPKGTETFISPNATYASQYNGVTVKFTVRNRTVNWLAKIGVRDTSALVSSTYPSMPVVSKGWMAANAFFKAECGIINIGLGFGTALELFNRGILSFGLI